MAPWKALIPSLTLSTSLGGHAHDAEDQVRDHVIDLLRLHCRGEAAEIVGQFRQIPQADFLVPARLKRPLRGLSISASTTERSAGPSKRRRR